MIGDSQILVREPIELDVIAAMSDGSFVSPKSLVWTSFDATVINTQGLSQPRGSLLPLKAGTVSITVAVSEAAAIVVLKVKTPVDPLEYIPNEGANVYSQNCAVCHGDSGDGGAGPALLVYTAEDFEQIHNSV